MRRKPRKNKNGTYGYVCRDCSNKSGRKYYHSNPTKQKERRALAVDRTKNNVLKRYYGIDIEQYNSMLLSQENKCAICDKEETAVHGKSKEVRQLNVDHCHNTGLVRGLLCTNCNFGLGKFLDSPDLLNKAIQYLERTI